MSYVGICGTDAEILHGRMPDTFLINYPHSLGHEWSGTVEAVGAEVTRFQPGDRVLGHGHLGGNDWFGVTHDGAAAEIFTVPASLCFHVPDNTSLLSAAVIEPFACVLQGLTSVGGVNAADTVHVHGLGAIGLNALLQGHHAGAQVVVFDPSAVRRKRALELGAVAALDYLVDLKVRHGLKIVATNNSWGGGEFDCLVALWNKESGWRVNAMNPYSGAYGIPQALPGSKMASAGADWETNAATQIEWGLGYIAGRYGTPCGAWGHSQSVGWY
jgi:threonine dehydrogenase-like Zn-dependent dehydrogenase